MFDIGIWELLVIGIVALIVVGPKQLPDVARTLGRWTGIVRRFRFGMHNDLRQTFRNARITAEFEDIADEITTVAHHKNNDTDRPV